LLAIGKGTVKRFEGKGGSERSYMITMRRLINEGGGVWGPRVRLAPRPDQQLIGKSEKSEEEGKRGRSSGNFLGVFADVLL